MPSTTITFDAPTATRIGLALGKALGLVDGQGNLRSATVAEYNTWVMTVTKRMVQGQELADAHAAVVQPADVVLT